MALEMDMEVDMVVQVADTGADMEATEEGIKYCALSKWVNCLQFQRLLVIIRWTRDLPILFFETDNDIFKKISPIFGQLPIFNWLPQQKVH